MRGWSDKLRRMPTYDLLKPLLFRLDPERAHGLGKQALRAVAAVEPLDAR